jgi:hypothetical protein
MPPPGPAPKPPKLLNASAAGLETGSDALGAGGGAGGGSAAIGTPSSGSGAGSGGGGGIGGACAKAGKYANRASPIANDATRQFKRTAVMTTPSHNLAAWHRLFGVAQLGQAHSCAGVQLQDDSEE